MLLYVMLLAVAGIQQKLTARCDVLRRGKFLDLFVLFFNLRSFSTGILTP